MFRNGIRSISRMAAVLAVLVLATAACGDDDDGDTAATSTTDSASVTTAAEGDTDCTPASPPVEVRQAATFSLLGLPLFVANDQGFFADNGIELSVIEATGGPAAASALLAGDADVMINAPDSVLLAHEQGQPLKIIAGSTVRGKSVV